MAQGKFEGTVLHHCRFKSRQTPLPGVHWIEGLVDPRVSVDTVRKPIKSPMLGTELRASSSKPFAIPVTGRGGL
jgi:hypothetical protein